ncbi:helicase-exonuclease AddAB subunit AddB [Clostridium guangxiense]|uniref:helicase-exonuclease AddAB subunit AddB n=1 Tax=Clostridium guangxiense TaxID=1662055 RepID=UPI001E4417A8|nr:helicase-exonuclease AddAB subunit AddB [Clostridium guangxiense]MCD2345308.1 helicase-exonuclease AddAB subunit AddB [Clostridium guangxiense]
MSLRFIYGRAGSGKSQFCIESINKRVNDGGDKPLIFIVPEQFSFQSEKNILNVIGERAALRVKVLSFKRLAYKVFNEVGGVTRKHLDPAGRNMLIYHIMDEHKDELKTFSAAARKQGFVDTVSESISEFKKYEVTPDILINALNKIDNTELKNKLYDLSFIYKEFDNLIQKNYIDPDDDLTLLKEKIDYTNAFNGAEVWIDEFSSFTVQQYSIIEKLVKKCSRVNITLCMDGEKKFTGSDVFLITEATENRILKIASENNIKLEKPVFLNEKPFYRFRENKELAFLENNLYAFPYEIFKEKTTKIKICNSTNSFSELESVAREIISLCRDKNYRLNDIAVVTGNLDSYEKIISVIFKEYGIPYFIDQRRSIEDNNLVVLVNSIMEVFIKNWSYEAVFRYLKSGFSNIETEDIDLIENYVLAAGIKGRKKWVLEDKWHYNIYGNSFNEEISEEDKEKLVRVNDIRQRIIEPFKKFREKIMRKNTASEICSALFEFLYEINVPEKVERLVDEFKEEGKQVLANIYSQIWNVIMGLMDQIVEVMGDEKVNLEKFSKILLMGIKEHEMGLIPSSVDQVIVGSVSRLKSHCIKNLFIVGVNDGIFPSAGIEEGILTDNDRGILLEKGVELAKDTKTRAFEEQFLVYTTLTNCSDHLIVSYPMADIEGKSLRPSMVINRLKTLFPLIDMESDILENEDDEKNMNLISSEVPTFNEMVSAFRKNIDDNYKSELWRDVYRFYSKNEKWASTSENIFSGMFYTNQVDSISREKAEKLYGTDPKMSVSRFEKYISCPFAYYVQYGLKLKERKLFNLTAPDIGSFMHKVIDEFCIEIKKSNMKWEDIDEGIRKKLITDIVDKEIGNNVNSIFSSSPKNAYFTGRIKKVLLKTSEIVTEHFKRGNFEPVGYEVSFENGGNYPPIIVEIENGRKVVLTGRIDRIDMLEKDDKTYIRIIDYKSGNKIFKLSDVYYGLEIQLLLYLDAIMENEGENTFPAGALYLKMDNPVIKDKKNMTDEEIREEILKSFKMKGLLLSDPDIIKEMDKEMEGNSVIIPASIKKDGNLGKSSAISDNQFDLLMRHVRNIIMENCNKLINGNIKINPYKKKENTPCEYCIYSSICRFDMNFEDNNYRYIEDKKDDEVWKLIENEKGGEEDE